jgi:outer membrane lipoprotein SlyB
MRVHETEGRTLYVQEDDGRLILRVQVQRIAMVENGYRVELLVPQGEGDPEEALFTAVSQPRAKT